MSFWILMQILVNVIFLAGVAFLWVKLQRPPKDDPRLSRGLQILQSKISVLEDLSDNTERQVQQAIQLIDRKMNDLQGKILEANKQVEMIENSRSRSLEVAKIFQDKIPHQEIIERQNTIKYVKAARLAHQGLNVDEIAKQVDLTRGELEFIAKVNRNQLQFSEADLPDWAQDPSFFAPEASATKFNSENSNLERSETTEAQPLYRKESKEAVMSALGQRFRQAVDSNASNNNYSSANLSKSPTFTAEQAPSTTPTQSAASSHPSAPNQSQARGASRPALAQSTKTNQVVDDFEYANNARGETVRVKKMVFPKVNANSL